MTVKKLTIDADNNGRRIDNFLISIYKNIPKSKIYNIIRKGEVRVNSSRIKPHYKLRLGDLVRIPPNLTSVKKLKKIIKDKDIANHTNNPLYEDSDYLVLNKKAGISVHGGTKNLVGLIDIVREKFGANIDLCHRLDKDTTGCIVFGKNKKAVKHFNESIKNHDVAKTYYAILKGTFTNEIILDTPVYKTDPVKSKDSTSKFKPIKKLNNSMLVEVQIYTGRTHQIRIHSSSIGHPIIFDNKYGDIEFNKSINTKASKNIALHSKSIIYKDINSKYIRISSDLPDEFECLIKDLQ